MTWWDYTRDQCTRCGTTAEQIRREQMSTSWTYQCDSHNPPERADSDGWTYKSQLETDLKRRAEINTIPEFVWVECEVEVPRHYRWLRFHQECAASVVSEYGEVSLSVDGCRSTRTGEGA